MTIFDSLVREFSILGQLRYLLYNADNSISKVPVLYSITGEAVIRTKYVS